MKKNIYRILATTFAFALVVVSPIGTITSHAMGFNQNSAEDTTDYGKRPSGLSFDTAFTSEPAEPAYSESAEPAYSEPADNSSNYGSDTGIGFNANSKEDTTNYGVKPSKNANDVIVRVAGGQTFRNVMNADHTSYQVYHCGNSIVTFTVTDDKDNVVEFKTVTLEQGEDKLWYENITFTDDVDVKGLTLNVTKGDVTYLSTELGVSGIKINGTVVMSTVPTETEAIIGHRYCSCGASFDIYENSGIDKDAWSAHAREHAAKGESARYTDK